MRRGASAGVRCAGRGVVTEGTAEDGDMGVGTAPPPRLGAGAGAWGVVAADSVRVGEPGVVARRAALIVDSPGPAGVPCGPGTGVEGPGAVPRGG
ncbi:hypothetical protein ACWD4G_12590 [Streptomyces sp. NPDC002643]